MYRITFCLLAAGIVFAAFSEAATTTINLSDANREIRVNTADYYSWNTRTDIFAFKYSNASEFAHLLKNCISAYGRIQINEKLNMVIVTDEPNKLKDILVLCQKLDTPEMKDFVKIQSEIIPVNYSQASQILPFIKNYLSVEGSVKANDTLNFIAVTDHQEIITRIRSEIGKFDIPPRQIEFKLHVAEVYKDKGHDIGTSWGEIFNMVHGQASYNYQTDSRDDRGSTASYAENYKRTSSGFNSSVSIDPAAISRFITLMIEKKQINLVTDNSLLCVNNTESRFLFAYDGKNFEVAIKPSAINDKTMSLRTRITTNGKMLLENSMLSEIGKSNLLLRLAVDNSETTKRTVPLLGTVLPYLFSKSVKNHSIKSVDIVCTPVLQTIGK